MERRAIVVVVLGTVIGASVLVPLVLVASLHAITPRFGKERRVSPKRKRVMLPPSIDAAQELTRDEALAAYQVAADLYMQENHVTWNRFNVMVTANSIIIAATAIALQERKSVVVALAIILPLIGLLLCHTWDAMTRRGFLYHDLWRAAAFKIEYEAFEGRIHTIEYAEQFRHHRQARIRISNTSRRFVASWGTPTGRGATTVDGAVDRLNRAWGSGGTNDVRAGDFAITTINVFRTLYVLAFVIGVVAIGAQINWNQVWISDAS